MKVLRELKIRLSLDGDAQAELKRANAEVDRLKAKFEPVLKNLPPEIARTASGLAQATEQVKKHGDAWKRVRDEHGRFTSNPPPKPIPTPEINKATNAMAEFAKVTGYSQATLQKMIDATKKDMHLEEQFKKAALAVGLTEKEVDRLNSKLKNAEQSSATFANIFKGLAALGVTAAAFSFGSKAIDESNRAENALIGFKTVVKNTLGAGLVDETTNGVNQLFRKLGGSMDLSTIQMSVKNLLGAGFSASQAIELVEKNAYMASVNRQAQFKTIGEAVQTYTEGIKNNNAMLTDSTGISENLSVTLKKVGLKMDDLNVASKRAAVLQAIHNFHTKEGGQYLDAYQSQMAGYQGQVIKANAAMSKILQTSGDFIKLALTPLIKLASPVLDFFSDSERGSARTNFALGLLTTTIGVGLVSATWSWVTSLNAVAIAKVAAFGEIIAIALGVSAALTAVYLVFEDIYTFLEYGPEGSETFFGDMLKWIGLTDEEMQGLSDNFKEFKAVMSDAWERLKSFAGSDTGKTFLKIAGIIALIVIAVAFWPVVVIAAFAVMAAYIIAKWEQIKQGFWTTVEFLKKLAITAGKILISTLFPIAGLYIFRNEIKAAFEYLLNLFKSTDFGKMVIDQLVNLKNYFSSALSGVLESAKGAMVSLLPVDTINTVIDMINSAMSKLADFSASAHSIYSGIPVINWADIPHIQPRATGGPINSGQPYLVGEKGPEIIIPGSSGNVIPNDRLSNYQSGGTFNITVNATINSGASAQSIAVDLYEQILEVFKANQNDFRVRMNMEPA